MHHAQDGDHTPTTLLMATMLSSDHFYFLSHWPKTSNSEIAYSSRIGKHKAAHVGSQDCPERQKCAKEGAHEGQSCYCCSCPKKNRHCRQNRKCCESPNKDKNWEAKTEKECSQHEFQEQACTQQQLMMDHLSAAPVC